MMARGTRGNFRAFIQENVEYTFTCGTLLGARALTQPFRAQFGDSLTHINCRYAASDAAAVTHTANRLVFTPTPGEFGAHVQLRDGGYGYGLQYLDAVSRITAPAPGAAV
jgi:hypothetical protein